MAYTWSTGSIALPLPSGGNRCEKSPLVENGSKYREIKPYWTRRLSTALPDWIQKIRSEKSLLRSGSTLATSVVDSGEQPVADNSTHCAAAEIVACCPTCPYHALRQAEGPNVDARHDVEHPIHHRG